MRGCFTQRFSIFLVFLICFYQQSIAQNVESDTVFYKKAVDNTVLLYHQQMQNQRGVFNGVNYYGYPFPFENGHPYFNTSNPAQGSVIYKNVIYPSLLLSYDEVADVLILHQNNRTIQLLSERISRFEIADQRFINITQDNMNSTSPKPGFYQLLYEGNVSLMKKEIKKINDYIRTKGEGVLKNIDVEAKYYIKVKNNFYLIKNKQSILQAYKDKKENIENFIESKQLNFKRDKERMLIEVTAFYDQITK